ncbi:unnamed protein product [Chrysodeixis includens]|uniref:Uncharacterized protein n=1 Tax=Chrysodeixis includens TaxID=689277 RepID=A0A9P0FW83_CHRIL|nr:unnamed protein product [Chrysodeixis includens]
MVGLNVVFLHSALVAAFVLSVSCITQEDALAMEKTIKPITKKCLEECGLDELKEVRGDLDSCFKKCAAKKLKVLDDNNQLDRKVLHELFVTHISKEVEATFRQRQFEECYDEQNGSVAEDSEAEIKRINIMMECLSALF